ncbi:hypothetical protein MVLG_05965 [Microbotryum lychnidis-dioicae p1A1 Lamole]|uniref:Uncharacterized protein n=1 Tax=Microbotryum lychnidis-dioicae (strain p1A1 Lamole / MvSl-1064) TaxID=683840 RepID=U5HFT9_USTV1|nr:hypothetical protein MVLG_05965 [Microbotryum lychnidis-dioicae p1A1 Lamole]|eukprot:KDE03580.1 hypothetical protein MVLG_05965 [Microbotryum lychnidis-dioicae p1A1 Lamole]
MSRSKTSVHLSELGRPWPSSSSLSALSTLASASTSVPVASSSTCASSGLPRSSHSTLTMPPSNLNGGAPSFLAPTSYSRQGSPAPSSNAGAGYSRRSPSPTRNQLAGTMSAFNFNSHDAASDMRAGSRAGSSSAVVKAPTSNTFGLQSRSPFVVPRRAPSIARSASVSSIAGASTNGAGVSAAGHSLFPYASPKPRGASPSALSTSRSVSSSLNHKKSYVALSGALNSPRARVGSPLNPHLPTASVGGSASVYGGASVDPGFERARKKQMVWDPEKGLVSREAMEREREATQAPPPKNEAERILEVLEGMGRTPLGEAQRAIFKPINVPVPQASTSSLLSRSASTPLLATASPYGRRAPVTTATRESTRGVGLEAQLRAREERRRAQIEREREEREQERLEDEERERQRVERRRRRRDEEERLKREEEDEMLMESIEDEETAPVARRKTRSMAAKEPKPMTSTPAKPRAGTGKGKAAAASTTPARVTRRSARKAASEESMQADDVPMSPPPAASRRRAVKSPSPVKEASPSPPPPEPTPVESAPALSYKPITEAERAANTSSSLRPGRSHTSRTHTASSKIFSAREEDLPPVDENELGKIKLPEMKFPANFSFGPIGGAASSTASTSTTKATPAPAPVSAPATSTNSLFGRLAPTSSEPASSKPNAAPTPFPFAPPPAPKNDNTTAPPAPKTSMASDFFSKPPTLPTFSSDTSMTSSTKPPDFFATVSAAPPTKRNEVDAPPLPTLPSASDFFGVNKPAEAKQAPAPAPSTSNVANPFAALGKPVAVIIGESSAENAKAAPPMFGSASSTASPFGASSGVFGAAPKQDGEKDTPSAKPVVSFGAPASSATSSTSAPTAPAPLPSFSFGTPAPTAATASSSTSDKKAEDTPQAAPAPFTFGAPAASSAAAPASTASAPSFSFGQPPAAAEKKPESGSTEKPVAPTAPTPSAGFEAAPLMPPVVVMPSIDDGDEDSGMEDETGATDSNTAPKPSPFRFGQPAAGASSPSPFGSSPVFGASAPTSAAPFSFGAQAATTSQKPTSISFGSAANTAGSSSLFGGVGAATSTPFGGFSPSPSPGPPSAGLVNTAFSFGTTSSAAPSAPTASAAPAAFTFGAPSGSTISSGGLFGNSGTSTTNGNMFGSAGGAAMSQTLSAPGFGAPTAPAVRAPFGAPSAIPSFTFGASSNPGTPTTSSTFTFSAPPSSTPMNSNGGFAGFGVAPTTPSNGFGSGLSNPAGGGGTSFGAPSAPVGVSSNAPLSPAGGAGALFSIGSGGDESPNKRKIAPLRRRRG